MSRHWKSFVNNVTNELNISRRLLASDILTESELNDYKRAANVAGKAGTSRRKQWLVNFFEPYYEQINLTYRNQDEGLRCITQAIERIREIRSQNTRQQELARLEAEKAALEARIKQLKEDDEMFKAAKAKTHSMDEESLNLDRKRNEPYALWMFKVPPPPIPPIQPVRYVDTVDYAVNQLLNDVDKLDDESPSRVLELVGRLYEHPFDTPINIDDFNREEINLLSNYLLEWFNETMLPRINDPILVVYEVEGMKPVRHPLYKDVDRIINMFKKNQFFDIEEKSTSINAYDKTIHLNMFSRIYFLDISGNAQRPDGYRSVHGDGFFPRKLSGNYKLFEPFLERYQIYASYVNADNKPKSTVNVPCFPYALQMAGIDKETTDKILAYVGFQKRINRKQWTDICNEFNLRIHLRIVNEKGQIDNGNRNNKGWYGPTDGKEIYLAEYLNHVFIDETLPITGFAVRNWDTIHDMKDDVAYLLKTYKLKNGKPSIDNKKANLRSLDVIKAINEAGGFESINATDNDVITANVFGYEIQEPAPIATPYNEKAHTRTIEPDKRNNKEADAKYPIFYADFETCKQTIDNIKGVSDKAIPFMLCITSQSGKWEHTYTGFDCMDQMMNEIAEKVNSYAVIYFHNLGFDGNFLMKYADKQMIKKGNKIMRMPLSHNGKIIELRDSYSLFPKKLSSFPSSFPEAFKGTNIQKEFFPYDYYTYDRIEQCLEYLEYQECMCETGLGQGSSSTASGGDCEIEDMHCMHQPTSVETVPRLRPMADAPTNRIGNFKECKKELKLSLEDTNQFIRNSNAIKASLGDFYFDMLKYCQFYCLQDVRVLRTGFEAFAKATAADPINLNIHNFLSVPALADYYMKKNVFYPNGNIKELNGPVQKFIQQAVYGGRCMTAYNKRHTITTPLYDFDARSLYPSAMRRMFTVEGAPEYYNNPSPDTIFNATNLPDILIHAFDETQVRATKEKYAPDGSLVREAKYISQFFVEIDITNVGIHRAFPLIVKREDNKQTNCNECVKMVVDMITLQDLITFQDISFKLGNGYIMKGNRDYRVQQVIQKLYDLRNEYKKTGNPTQEVIKLIMNSAYGKSIQKPIKSFLQFVKKDAFDWFVKDRYHQIQEITQIDEDSYLFELAKQKSLQFNNCVFGVTVLSMSKRIMNEVMCLAEDEGINIYYQDTDSMHIEADKLQQLAEAFKNKYNRELIGDAMGQFHDDFDELKHNPRAIVHISAGKKMYYDKLINDNGETAEHFRLKGVPQQCIINTAAKRFNGNLRALGGCEERSNVQALYEALYNGESIDFDLLDGKVCMVMDKSGHVYYKSNFNRNVKATSQI